jgi:hypothetical protein
LSNSPKLGRPTKYNWDEIADGATHVLEEGKDFDCTAESFVILVRRTARVRHQAVSVCRANTTVTVQFYITEECSASAV